LLLLYFLVAVGMMACQNSFHWSEQVAEAGSQDYVYVLQQFKIRVTHAVRFVPPSFTPLCCSVCFSTMNMDAIYYCETAVSFNELHRVISHKIEIFIIVFVRNSNSIVT
jgi:hypothetical protein